MQFKTILELIKSDPAKLIEKVKAVYSHDTEKSRFYFPETHDVMDETIRRKRRVVSDSEEKDANGNPALEANGQPKTKTEYVEVNRITSAAQKQIVDWAVAVCAGVPAEPEAKVETEAEKTLFEMLKRTIIDNKLDYIDREILRLRKVYKICAEVWYSEKTDREYWSDLSPSSTFKMRVAILSEETGDLLYPVRDSIGDMVALGREYKIKGEDGKDLDCFDLFTKDAIYNYQRTTGGWNLEKRTIIRYGKANFVVHEQNRLEWEDVQNKIDRLELLSSNIADSNDALAYPMLAITGKIEGMAKRGETGKVFQLENGAKMEILESRAAPDALKMERENLVKEIFTETNTPQFSISDAQGFGANVPGITVKLLFLPATLKAMSDQSGTWGMCIQRRYNFLKSAIAVINVNIKSAMRLQIQPRFQIYMPSNDAENYSNIIALYKAGLLSRELAITKLGIAENTQEEINKILADAKPIEKVS